ncbi:sigma factor-like helix-turn-helix DNA-binding protein [Sphingomonas sp. MMS24-J45]|uniref:sigma factor-like helix-turn-helix DNA-binding protein n=1 Tax=Sphingomonas sp. MMS24-J45 TaxID=3238806 RepID=UPI00384C7758
MSKTTVALEAAVSAVIANMPKGDDVSPARQRAAVDKAFAAILKLIAPRIRHFIRQYGLVGHWEDAEQCCAIAVHRAIQGYDPAKAMFTTFVNWQIRGELQSLRFRVMTDQRPSAKKVDATTVSLHSIVSSADGDEATLELIIEDDGALARTEAGASDYLAHAATRSLVDEYIEQQRLAGIEQLRKRPRPKRVVGADPVDHGTAMLRRPRSHGVCPTEIAKLEQKLERDKEIVERRVFDAATLDELGANTGVTKERVRQITKRASRSIAELAASQPRFAVMAEYRKTPARPVRARSAKRPAGLAPTILPASDQPHNTLARVVALEAQAAHPAPRAPHDLDAIVAAIVPTVGADLSGGNAPGSKARH